jgi:uncharacterized membrane protein
MRGNLSIWFFTGVMLTCYGLVIFATGLWELSHPPVHVTVLANLHPAVWWGAILLVVGIGYLIKFTPRRR